MFGKKSKLERVKADAKADYLKCGALDPEDRLHRVFAARIAQRARLNLDKIFVQGAKAEEKRQLELAEAIKAAAHPSTKPTAMPSGRLMTQML